jgi:cyclopropane fatty-acyl-phospholipid synthase-like methyltransferase
MEKKADAIYEAYMGDMDKDFTRKVRERIHWICNHVQGSNVLDVGCSQGITSILLGRENKSVIGLDVEQRCIDFANESLKTESAVVQGKVLFKQEDFISFKSEDSYFDTIVMTEVLEHIFNVEGFLEKAKHLLKVNGKLIVTVPFGINDSYDHKRTYYFYELYEKLQKYFLVEQVEFFGKWIGYICKNDVTVSNDNTVNVHYVIDEEKAFYLIERGLVDTNKRLNENLKKTKDNYTELLNKAKAEKVSLQNQVKVLEQEKRQLTNACTALTNEKERRKKEVDKLKSEIELVYKEKLSDYELMVKRFKESVIEKNEIIKEKNKEIDKYTADYKLLQEKLTKQKQRTAYWKHKRDVLANSKLGRFTLKYWSFKDSLKGKKN